MTLGMIATAAALAGVVYGAVRCSRPVVAVSAVALILVMTIWAFCWLYPS